MAEHDEAARTGGRAGPLTWAQQEWLSGLPVGGASSFEDNMSRELRIRPLDFGRTRAAVLAVLERHEMLRSRVGDRSSPDPQLVDEAAPGLDRVLETVALPQWDRLLAAARCTCFQLGTQWPVKILVGGAAGEVSRVAFVVDHWAADGLGVRVLVDDLTAALSAAAGGGSWAPRGPVEQPVDLARRESRTPEGSRQLERSLDYWRRQLEELRPHLAGYTSPPSARPADAPPARFPGLALTSGRLLDAATIVARRNGAPTSAVFLAAFSAAIAAAEQVGAVGTLMLSANRFSAAARRSIRNAIMQVPVVLTAPKAGDLDAAVRAAAAQQLLGHRFANADPNLTKRVAADVLGGLQFSAVAHAKFNYLAEAVLWGDRPPSGRRADDDVLESLPVRTQAAKFMLTVHERPGTVTMDLRWREDTSWQRFAEPLLVHVADLIRHAAAAHDAPPVFAV